MSTISTTNYYTLSNTSSNSTDSKNTSSTQQLPSLAAILDSNNNTSGNADSLSSYHLDLSPTAQAYLAKASTSSSTANSSNSSSTSDTIQLSKAQQQKLTSILEKYKDEPFTQATFDQIQDDMTAAGLGVDQLSAQDTINQYNPTAQLISALNGVSTTTPTADSISSKRTNFIQSVISQWQSLSTTAGDTASTS